MYLRHTTRRKDGKTHTYWRLVRSVRMVSKVRQETVSWLGPLDTRGRAKARRLAELTAEMKEAGKRQAAAEWQVLGLFDGAPGFAAKYGPEADAETTKTYPGKGDKKLSWKKFSAAENAVTDDKTIKAGGPGVLFARTSVESPQAMPASLMVGAYDSVQVWVNGESVLEKKRSGGLEKDKLRVEVKLKPGKNTVLVKNWSNRREVGFSLRFADEKERPIPGVVFISQ